MSHSKRNTSLAFFTAHERNELKGHWGSQSTRLTRDSFLPFGSCQLCLQPTRGPVSCPSHGHLFCRECAVNNLLAQNKELKRLKAELEKRKLEDADAQNLKDAEAQEKAVEEFERTQAGLSSKRTDSNRSRQKPADGDDRGVKRKLEEEDDELVRQAREGMSKRRSDRPKSELPSFWVPGETPDNNRADLRAIKPQLTCPAAAAESPHEFGLKTLVTVNFTEDKPTHESESPTRTCPSCNKALSNATKAILAKPCGHVICSPCSEKFQKSPEIFVREAGHVSAVRCYVCQEDITPGRRIKSKKDPESGKKEKTSRVERGMVELYSDGTGFAGRGTNMVKRAGTAFQC
ncbi:Hypothetical protein R9X50_00179500 [Acrodontium crateriforme]|uniref:RING-type domain-containing protein n=1 Tax=Acrodontium crateriforme TaxID=150365 RepID=A0AAQ3R643_9PEZI|nr:Hypothetical protein R9X50_00179500 [Acrodontium crateriforme]